MVRVWECFIHSLHLYTIWISYAWVFRPTRKMLQEKAYCHEGLGAGYFLPLCNAVQTLQRSTGYLRLKGSTAGPQVQQCSTQNYLQREARLLRTMAGCVFSMSKGRVSTDGAFPHPQLQHTHGDFFPLTSNQCFLCCISQPLLPCPSLGTSENLALSTL